MAKPLNGGKGRCRGTARLPITPSQSVIELGAVQDLLMKALNAVHHANRHANPDDFIAVALPGMTMGRNCMRSGHEIELIGSEASLTSFLYLDGPVSLKRRGMILPFEIEEVFMDVGAPGAAYVRDRTSAKGTPGWVRRSQTRAERRGKPVGKPMRLSGNDTTLLALFYAQTVIHVQQLIGDISDEPLMVSTYGFSSSAAPATLPVRPVILELHDEA